MSKKDSHAATQEAKRDLTGHPERPTPHQDAIGKYLSALAYGQTRRDGEERDRDPDTPPER